jgi:nucleotide-binding universal stress UspA family protein
MSLKDILAIVVSAAGDEPAFSLSERLARDNGAEFCAAYLNALPEEPLAYEPTVVSGVWAELLARARSDSAAEKAAIEARLARAASPCALRTDEALARDVGRIAAVHARYADITVMTRPSDDGVGALRLEMIEGVLFHAGRPALIAPPDYAGDEIGRTVVLAWDASREATRALAEARPFLAKCARPIVLTVDAKPKAFGHGEQPGLNIAGHLARRGVSAEVRNVDSMGRSVSDAILDEVRSVGADMLVMGAYAHSRLREMMFGGATRELLHASTVPILMAH